MENKGDLPKVKYKDRELLSSKTVICKMKFTKNKKEIIKSSFFDDFS